MDNRPTRHEPRDAIAILRRWVDAALDGAPLQMADRFDEARAFLREYDEQQDAGPKTVAELGVRALNAIDRANGLEWQPNLSQSQWTALRIRYKRMCTAKRVFEAGLRRFRIQSGVGHRTIAELESVLRSNGFDVANWRSR